MYQNIMHTPTDDEKSLSQADTTSVLTEADLITVVGGVQPIDIVDGGGTVGDNTHHPDGGIGSD